jgi:glutamate-1-semialdehyde 2,1-aminomutase
MVLDYNDAAGLRRAFDQHGTEIAAVIVEPVVGNMNLIVPRQEFLDALRELCTRHAAVLIFDEVMTGFRVHRGGAQALYGICPDLTTLGKIVGGGLPLGAFGGRREIMQYIAPQGPVYQAGTLSGNPVAVAAGLATLAVIEAGELHETLAKSTRRLSDGLARAAAAAGVPFSAQAVGGMFGFYFRSRAPESFAEVMESDGAAFNRFFHLMLERGVYFAPSAFEAGFVSAAHTAEDIDATVAAAVDAFKALRPSPSVRTAMYLDNRRRSPPGGSAQPLDVLGEGLDFSVGQLGRDHSHHLVGVVRALARAPCFQLRRRILSVLAR